MPTTLPREAEQLADELVKRLGAGPYTPSELAAALTIGPLTLISAVDDVLMRAAAADEPHERDGTPWAPAPSDVDVRDARRTAQQALDDAMEGALDRALTREEAARRLGISTQAVSKRVAAGALVALTRGRSKRFPLWQFHEDGVLPGLGAVIAAYPGGSLSLSTWATTPSPDLDRVTPAQALARRGGVPRVLEALRALAPDAW
jgi:hypothetical protein